MPLRENSVCVLLTLPVESKLLLADLMDKYGEKDICHINSCIPGTPGCVNLLKR